MALGENSQLDLGNERLTICCGVTIAIYHKSNQNYSVQIRCSC